MTRRRTGFRWRGLLIFGVVVVVLLVAADRIALAVAERKVASKVQSAQNLASRPAVHITGFPFLTQVIANRYRTVRLSARGVKVGAGTNRIAISTLTAQLHGVRATGNYSGVTAETVQGTAELSYPELSRVVGAQLGFGGSGSDGTGRVQATRSVSALGQTISATVSAQVGITDGQLLTFSAVRVEVANGVGVPQAVADQLSSIFKNQLSLAGLPFGLRIQRVVAGPAGVAVSATAHDVNLE